MCWIEAYTGTFVNLAIGGMVFINRDAHGSTSIDLCYFSSAPYVHLAETSSQEQAKEKMDRLMKLVGKGKPVIFYKEWGDE